MVFIMQVVAEVLVPVVPLAGVEAESAVVEVAQELVVQEEDLLEIQAQQEVAAVVVLPVVTVVLILVVEVEVDHTVMAWGAPVDLESFYYVCQQLTQPHFQWD